MNEPWHMVTVVSRWHPALLGGVLVLAWYALGVLTGWWVWS